MEKPVFVIGDVHGHADSLQRLLALAGIPPKGARDMEVVQLGDLGHFGAGSGAGDAECIALAHEYIDVVLWGNHDRAIVDWQHAFRGYVSPSPAVLQAFSALKPKFAHACHGWLLTHAGLNPKLAPVVNGEAPADWWAWYINNRSPNTSPLLNAIGFARGGDVSAGGILWRDVSELLMDIPQVFGHTRAREPLKLGTSWCIDVASVDNNKLCGLWLPEERIVSL